MNNSLPWSVAFDQGTLLLPGRDREEVESIFGSDLWTWDPRVSSWRCEAFHYRRVILALWGQTADQQQVQNKGQKRTPLIRYHDQARQWSDVQWPEQNIHPPRPSKQRPLIAGWLTNAAWL